MMRDDRKEMVTQITTLYNSGEHKTTLTLNIEPSGLQQQKTASGFTPASRYEESEADQNWTGF